MMQQQQQQQQQSQMKQRGDETFHSNFPSQSTQISNQTQPQTYIIAASPHQLANIQHPQHQQQQQNQMQNSQQQQQFISQQQNHIGENVNFQQISSPSNFFIKIYNNFNNIINF